MPEPKQLHPCYAKSVWLEWTGYGIPTAQALQLGLFVIADKGGTFATLAPGPRHPKRIGEVVKL